jgi:hypothetical protein
LLNRFIKGSDAYAVRGLKLWSQPLRMNGLHPISGRALQNMSRATASALAVLRVPKGAPRPSEEEFRAALREDRKRLGLDEQPVFADFGVAGPYPVVIDGVEYDEYVVWER